MCVCSCIRPTTVDQHEMACVDKSITHTIGGSERANGQECESLAKTWQKSHSPCPCPVTKLMMMMCPVTSAHTWPGSRANGVCANGCPAPQCVFVSRCAPEVDMPITPVAKREIWLRLGFMRVTFGAGHTTHGAPNPDFCIRFIYFSVR